jgi:predicted transposase YdaD
MDFTITQEEQGVLLADAREVGREEGRQEGREVGREEGREVGREEVRQEGREKAFRDMCEIARKMKYRGLSLEEIAEITGISQELIETL